MNTPVKFEIAKLLKEKKCDLNHEYMAFTYVVTEKYPEGELFLKPTIAEVVMWLYEKHGIWITVTSISQESWQCHMCKKGDSLGKCYLEDFYTPTEAYEAAIEYTLNNLI